MTTLDYPQWVRILYEGAIQNKSREKRFLQKRFNPFVPLHCLLSLTKCTVTCLVFFFRFLHLLTRLSKESIIASHKSKTKMWSFYITKKILCCWKYDKKERLKYHMNFRLRYAKGQQSQNLVNLFSYLIMTTVHVCMYAVWSTTYFHMQFEIKLHELM